MDLPQEKDLSYERYRELLRRIRYDDRDAAMYENMLSFLWDYIIGGPGGQKEDLYEEYTHWNLQYIDKVYYRPQDAPYIAVRRCYQSIIHLLDGEWKEGIRQLDHIGTDSFSYDGLAPKTIMTRQGTVYRPVSKLFILYNYGKYLLYQGHLEEAEAFRKKYSYAFRKFGDEKNKMHDDFLISQMEEYHDRIFYPVYHRIYKLPNGPKDFFIYYDTGCYFKIKDLLQ